MRLNRKIMQLERRAAMLPAKDYPKYFAFEELHSKRSTLIVQSMAIVACTLALVFKPGPLGDAVSALAGFAAAMVSCLLVTARSRHFALGAIARIAFVICCTEYLNIICQHSPNELFWKVSLCAILLIAMSPLHHEPVSHLLTALVVFLSMLGPVTPALGQHVERDWLYSLVASALVFGSLMNLRLFWARTRVYSVQRQLAELAFKDGLTRINNRRAFMGEWDDMARRGGPESLHLLLIDADDFKRVNDMHGHDVGDEVLQSIARSLQQLPGLATCGRLGGEEFGVLMRGSADQAAAMARTLNERIAAACVRQVRFTVSIGIAAQRWGEPPGEVMRRADQALYEAKRHGKNTYCVDAAVPRPRPACAAEAS